MIEKENRDNSKNIFSIIPKIRNKKVSTIFTF